jgi:hypothetical protein
MSFDKYEPSDMAIVGEAGNKDLECVYEGMRLLRLDVLVNDT